MSAMTDPTITNQTENARHQHRLTLAGKFYGKKARYDDFVSPSPSAQSLHFYGGNGFATGIYDPLLKRLAQTFAVTSLAMRGLWVDKPDVTKTPALTREQDADALIQFLEQTQDEPVIGVGHSQGATATALACAKRPDLFSHLILLEPVTFTKRQKILYDLMPRAIKHRAEPFKGTLVKQYQWASVSDYYNDLRAHRGYRRISDEHLRIFAENSLNEQSDGTFILKFSPEQELANYHGTPFITDALKKLNKLGKPYHIVLGKPSVFVGDKVRKSWQGIVADDDLTILPDYGHLLPMEAPDVCADIVLKQTR